MVDRLDDDATFEDIQYEVYVVQQVERGLQDVAAGRTLSREDVRGRLSHWLDDASEGRG